MSSSLNFSLVVAVDERMGIGKTGGLPWHLPGDLKHFKEITSSPDPSKKNVVIMGRKTWESLPERFRPLPQRINVVLTRDSKMIFPDGVLKADSLEVAARLVESAVSRETRGEIFVIGGGEIFKQAIHHPACRKLYLTHIHQIFDCDTFFPAIPKNFKEISRSSDVTENGSTYHFADYQKFLSSPNVSVGDPF